jgi:streptogramin lyase
MLGVSLLILSLIIASYSILIATNTEQQQQQLSYAQINQNQNLSKPVLKEFPVPSGSQPHDVAPVANGGIVWYTAQALGKLGWLDPNTGSTHEIALGQGSAPHRMHEEQYILNNFWIRRSSIFLPSKNDCTFSLKAIQPV